MLRAEILEPEFLGPEIFSGESLTWSALCKGWGNKHLREKGMKKLLIWASPLLLSASLLADIPARPPGMPSAESLTKGMHKGTAGGAITPEKLTGVQLKDSIDPIESFKLTNNDYKKIMGKKGSLGGFFKKARKKNFGFQDWKGLYTTTIALYNADRLNFKKSIIQKLRNTNLKKIQPSEVTALLIKSQQYFIQNKGFNEGQQILHQDLLDKVIQADQEFRYAQEQAQAKAQAQAQAQAQRDQAGRTYYEAEDAIGKPRGAPIDAHHSSAGDLAGGGSTQKPSEETIAAWRAEKKANKKMRNVK